MNLGPMICAFALLWMTLHATVALPQAASNQPNGTKQGPAQPDATAGRRLAKYVLGPGDEITIMSIYVPEIAKQPIRITTSGDINLTMIGRFRAAGRTVEQLEEEVRDRLKEYVKDPDIVINLSQFKSQPVSVLGAVGSPGVIQLEGVKTLIEVLSLAGGIRPEAGSQIKIVRRLEWGPIPLPSAKSEGEYSTAEVNIRSIENASHPEENIQILPYDIITVTRAEVVYVIGEGVKQPGAFTLSDRKGVSIIEALARAQGTVPNADQKNSKIIRPIPDGTRIEIRVNIKDILNGKGKDIVLQANDIFYVPQNEVKGTVRRTIDTVVSMTTGIIVYRGF